MSIYDQAQKLREQMKNQTQSEENKKKTRVITVTSGKGGVGKSNFTLNFALGLRKRGHKVVIFDADLGLANIDVLMSVMPKHNILEMIEKKMSIFDIIEKGPLDLEFIAGVTGFNEIFQLDQEKTDYFFEEISKLQGYADTIIIDTGAGMNKEALKFMLSSDEVVVVTTPEPTAITDAYAVIKMVRLHNPKTKFRLVINRSLTIKEGKTAAEKLIMVSKKILDHELDIDVLGYILDDPNVPKAVKKQVPFVVAYPQSRATLSIQELVDIYLDHFKSQLKDQPALEQTKPEQETTGIKGFLNKIRSLVRPS